MSNRKIKQFQVCFYDKYGTCYDEYFCNPDNLGLVMDFISRGDLCLGCDVEPESRVFVHYEDGTIYQLEFTIRDVRR